MNRFPTDAIVRVIVALLLFAPAAGAQDNSAPATQAAVSDLVNHGNQLMARNQYEAALADYEQALKLEPKDTPSSRIIKKNIVELYNNWGSHLFRQRDYGGCEEKLKKCLKLNPGHAVAHRNLELLKNTLESQGIPMSMELDEDGKSAPPEAPLAKKEKEKKPEEVGKIVGSSATSTPITPVGKQTLFGAGGMPESTTFVSGSATYPTYTKRPTATSAPAVTSVMSPNKPVRADMQQPSTTTNPGEAPAASAPEAPKAGSVEDKLSDLERRFEGCTHNDWPVLKRLEQLEIKVAGQAGSGRISDRIDVLQKL